jgi:uncharacterized membrane protein SirB2
MFVISFFLFLLIRRSFLRWQGKVEPYTELPTFLRFFPAWVQVLLMDGLVLLEPSGLAVQNAEWQVGTLLSLSPW